MRIILIALLFCSTAVLANGSIHHNNIAVGGGASSKAISNAQSRSNSYANQYQGQEQGQLQGQKATGGNVAINTKLQRSAPSFGLPAAFPTAVCQGTLAAGFSFWLGGGAAAGSITVEECMKLETIRVGTIMLQSAVSDADAKVQQKANNEVFCMTKYGKNTTMCGGNVTTASTQPKVVTVVAPRKVEGIEDESYEREITLDDLAFWR